MPTIQLLHTWKFTESTCYAWSEGIDCQQFAVDIAREYPHMDVQDVKCGFMREEPVFSPFRKTHFNSTVINPAGPGSPVVYARVEIRARIKRLEE